MATYLALFRGINVGKSRRLPMKNLVALLEEVGCTHIQTYIQSGNVIFDTTYRSRSKLSRDISAAIFQEYGFSPTVMLLTAAELQHAVAHNPFPSNVGKALHFFFLESTPVNLDLDRLNKLKSATEGFKIIDKVLYLYTPEGVGRSKLAINAERCLGVTATGRNWNTVKVLASMLEDKGR